MTANSEPELVVLAAGMGRRYGGVKQLDSVGPNGETLMEYSLFDAQRAGFKSALFIIKQEIEAMFQKQIQKKYENLLKISYVFQQQNDLPTGYKCAKERTIPWGTGHAILTTKKRIKNPFAVINADDFYGKEAFQTMYNYLKTKGRRENIFSLLAYKLKNTLSENGSVNRGLCTIKHNQLTSIKELHKLKYQKGRLTYQGETEEEVTPDSCVSMNFWGFTPFIFELLEEEFENFLQQNLHDPQAEFYITTVIDKAQKSKLAAVEVLATEESWMGITYPEDREIVTAGIFKAIANGEYPPDLLQPNSSI